MSNRDTIRLATRGSDLARRQAATVKEALESRRQDVELVEVETTGDRIRDELIHRLGKTGAFVRSLDEKVIDGDVDAAVHSMKDMPTDQPEELIVSGIPERGPPGDVLVTPEGTGLDDLPEGATVGTSSLRRQAQLLDARPDLTVEPLRGNVDTRVEKLLAPGLQAEHQARTDAEEERAEADEDEYEHPYERDVEEWFSDLAEIERRAMERQVDTEYDAIVLAEAGLDRSGLLHRVEYERLPTTDFVPSPGQGALAVTSLDDEVGETIHTALDNPRTRVETTVERTILAELGGGCVAPIGVYAVVQGEHVNAVVQVYSRDGGETVATSRDLSVERHVRDARAFAQDLAERGAAELIEDAKREEGEGEAKRAESDEE